MDNKKKNSFVAHPHLGFATKLTTLLFLMLILNFSSTFAYSSKVYTGIKNTSDFDITYFLKNSAFYNLMDSTKLQSVIDNSNIQAFQNLCNSKNYKYITIIGKTGKINKTSTNYEFKGYHFALSNAPLIKSNERANNFTYIETNGTIAYLYISKDGTVTYNSSLNNKYTMDWTDYGNVSYAYFFSTIGIYTNDKTGILSYSGVTFEPYKEIYNTKTILENYSKLPYFKFKNKSIGTTEIEGVGEVPVFYKEDIKGWSNSYTTGCYIADLYIDKNYIWDNIFMPALYITKANTNFQNKWYDKEFLFFKEEETDQYIRYSISIENVFFNTPYYYNICIQSIDKELSDHININFLVINKEKIPPTIAITSGDTTFSGDVKDNTTIGDIQNTLKEPYNPNKNILNQMNSGDILENLGYQTTEDPNADLWDTIMNGLKNTLTGTGEQNIEFKLRKNTYRISTNDLYVPNGTIKNFIGLFIDFWLLMQMFQFIKRTIDQINEGNLKVMHDVDADCYFF